MAEELPDLLAEWDKPETGAAINPEPADAWNADEERLEYVYDDMPDERDAAIASLESEVAAQNEVIANSEFQRLLDEGTKSTSLTADEISEQWKQALTDDNVHALKMVEAFEAGDKDGYSAARDEWITELSLLNPPAPQDDGRALFAALRASRDTPSSGDDYENIPWSKLTDQEFAAESQKVFEAAERGAFNWQPPNNAGIKVA